MEKKKNTYQYNEKSARYKRMNLLYLIAESMLWVMFIIYLLLKYISHSIAVPTAFGNIILILLYFVVNLIVYFRKKDSATLNRIVVTEMGVEFLLLGMQTNAEFLYFTILGILALQIPYYDIKAFKKITVSYTLIYTIVLAVRFVKHDMEQDVDMVCRYICIYLMFFVLYEVGRIAKMFSDHALGAVSEQSSRQKSLLDDILDISRTVQEESQKSDTLMDYLMGATDNVAGSMKEISMVVGATAESIEEQNYMTQNIQKSIGDVGECSKRMVKIASDSNKLIQDSMQDMDSLKTQSMQIASTNQKVTQAMLHLRDKTKEVEEITGMILNISSQTNLLALNASIESARAGEAGRGFAVVADQIRQLADQTRKSTEEITKIVHALNEYSNEVDNSVEQSVEATKSQSEKIFLSAESFEKLYDGMTQLIQDINMVDKQIVDLSDSNNRIVENISHLSAATQQVSASAEQVREMSEQNLDYAKETKSSIEQIRTKSDGVKKYFAEI